MLIYLLSLGIALGAVAAPASQETSKTATVTEDDLKQILLRYQGVSALDVDFQQLKTLKEMKQSLRSKGHLTVHPPASVIYKITSPAALTVILSAKSITIRTGQGSDQTTQVLNVEALKGSKEHRNLQAMVAWLEMNPHRLAADYSITRQPGETTKNEYHFVPLKNADAAFTSLDMTVSPDGNVSALMMHETSGDQIQFLFGVPKITHSKR